MGRFFNEKLKDMKHLPRAGMEQMRQDFRKQGNTVESTVVTPTVGLTLAQARMAKAREIKRLKREQDLHSKTATA